MKHSIHLLSLILILAVVNMADSRVKIIEGINIDAEFRPRLELDGRDFDSETGFDAYSTYRTRIGLELDNLVRSTSFYIMVGDSRTMGYSDPYLTGEPVGPNRFDNNLGVIKAYIEARNIIFENFYVKVGRMSNDQGRSLIFGPGNWNFYGPRTYDGIKIGYRRDDLLLNLWNFFGAKGDRHWYPEDDNPAAVPNHDIDYKRDHTLTGVDLAFLEKRFNLLAFLDLDQESITDTLKDERNVALSRITTALFASNKFGTRSQYWVNMDLAFQFGTMGHPGGVADISAHLIAADAGWQFSEKLKSWIGLGFHITSGDDGKNPDKVTYFYDKYCSKHKVLGHMDYFTSDTGVKSLGIRDLILRYGITPLTNLACTLDLHYFSVAKSFPSAVDSSTAKVLGWELDTTFNYIIHDGLQCLLGIDFFSSTNEWNGSDSDVATFFYLALSASL